MAAAGLSAESAALLRVDVTLDYRVDVATDILLAVEPLSDADQTVVSERLTLNGQTLAPAATPPPITGSARRRWLHVEEGTFRIALHTDVRVHRPQVDIATLPATPLPALPTDVAPALLASRYCAPTLFERVLADDLDIDVSRPVDGAAIIAMRDWIRRHIAYERVSTGETTAEDTFVARAGVCRDFAHLMIGFARAAHVPARFVACYAWQLDPPDFHAVAEVWLDGAWHLIDATGLAPEASLIRIARTRDAVDASFMTIFGQAEMVDQQVRVRIA